MPPDGFLAKWHVVSSRGTGKHVNVNLCEDVIATAPHLTAVIDGTTSSTGSQFAVDRRQVSPGRFAAITLAQTLTTLEPGVDPQTAVRLLTTALDTAIRAAGRNRPSEHTRPSASMIVHDAFREELWLVGDCRYALEYPDGSVEQVRPVKKVDEAAIGMRTGFLKALAASMNQWDPATGNPDPGRAVIRPLLDVQGFLANTTGPYGYGALNGLPVPARFVTVVSTRHVTSLVLASDGYPDLAPNGNLSIEDAESYLAQCLAADPACIQSLAGTKACTPGHSSFDDRAWVQLTRRTR